MNSGAKNKKSKFPIVMGIIWGGIIAVSIGVIVSIFSYDYDYFKNAESISSNIISEEYGTLFRDMNYRLEDGLTAEEHPEFAELIAVSHYYEACIQYHMFLNDNQTEKADYYYGKMQKAQKGLGQLQYLADKIDQFLRSKVCTQSALK